MRIRATFTVTVDIKANTEKPLKDIDDSTRDVLIGMAIDKVTKQTLRNSGVYLSEVQPEKE